MTEKQIFLRKRLLSDIHANKRYKEIAANEAWCDYLQMRFGVVSSKDLSIRELGILVDILNDDHKDMLNMKPDYQGRAIVKQHNAPDMQRSDKATTKQITAINSLWEQKSRDKSHESLMLVIQRLTGKLYLHVHMLSKPEATHVITILSNERKF